MTQIQVEELIARPIEKVWECWTKPEHIVQWNHASDDWHCPSARNDLRVGGSFTYRMEERKSGEGFDFGGVYSQVIMGKLIEYRMGDGRGVSVSFEQVGEGQTKVTEVFDPEMVNSPELQRKGWGTILKNCKNYCEKV